MPRTRAATSPARSRDAMLSANLRRSASAAATAASASRRCAARRAKYSLQLSSSPRTHSKVRTPLTTLDRQCRPSARGWKAVSMVMLRPVNSGADFGGAGLSAARTVCGGSAAGGADPPVASPAGPGSAVPTRRARRQAPRPADLGFAAPTCAAPKPPLSPVCGAAPNAGAAPNVGAACGWPKAPPALAPKTPSVMGDIAS